MFQQNLWHLPSGQSLHSGTHHFNDILKRMDEWFLAFFDHFPSLRGHKNAYNTQQALCVQGGGGASTSKLTHIFICGIRVTLFQVIPTSYYLNFYN
jgi:hypothetical protein